LQIGEVVVAGPVDTKVCKRSCRWQVLCMWNWVKCQKN